MTPFPLNSFSEVCCKAGARPFNYQMGWHGVSSRCRVLTKMRQCGADWYFSLEALADALVTGRNQIFLGCGNGHSLVNKAYINAFINQGEPPLQNCVLQATDHWLELVNGAHIHFIDPDSLCAGLSGNVYVSEYAWANSPKNVIAIAKGLSMHNRHHATYYTTPSDNPEALREHKKLIAGRSAVHLTLTPEDLRASDETLFSEERLNELKQEISAEGWKMLFMCEWPGPSREAM
ncbi:terminase family protein [Citrobacter portucalensis]|uniref:terminase large subunit domain-containing protein n=1 Tax=Citrobacter portucalensis TaxID=1639133 RepID=UPI00226B5490|nr:terminase family protein [Citrobacter portucalensis]MCX9038809.1 terminase family protein [Citrobacter portucalensis]